jgi:hypothetical protein
VNAACDADDARILPTPGEDRLRSWSGGQLRAHPAAEQPAAGACAQRDAAGTLAMEALLELARAHSATLASLLLALLAAVVLPLLLRGGRAPPPPAARRGPATLQAGAKARALRWLLGQRHASKPHACPPPHVPLAPQVELRLASREDLSHDTRRFRFALPARARARGVRVRLRWALSRLTHLRRACTRSRPRTCWACQSGSTSSSRTLTPRGTRCLAPTRPPGAPSASAR